MAGSLMDLSKYRYEQAKDNLEDARLLLESGRYKSSVNRSYYAIFHALRAVTALDGVDYKKHAGIISYINQCYVKAGIFDRSFSKAVTSAYHLRESADYKDFEIISKEETESQLQKAEFILNTVGEHVQSRWHFTNPI